jgi:hypothetical protein
MAAPSPSKYEPLPAKPDNLSEANEVIEAGAQLVCRDVESSPVLISSSMDREAVPVPVGEWRDGSCDCFAHGCCHGHCVTSWCCPLRKWGVRFDERRGFLSPPNLVDPAPHPHLFPRLTWLPLLCTLIFLAVAAGQVITRLNLTWEGRDSIATQLPAPGQFRPTACQTLWLIIILQLLVVGPLYVGVMLLEPKPKEFVFPSVDALDKVNQESLGDLLARLFFFFAGVILLWREPSVKMGFMKVFILVSMLWFLKAATGLDIFYNEWFFDIRDVRGYLFVRYLYDLASYCIAAGCIMIIRNVRHYVRAKYAIRPVLFSSGGTQGPSGDDCLMAWCCSCCTTAQMLRHTTDYNVYNSSMCSDRGLPYGTPGIL